MPFKKTVHKSIYSYRRKSDPAKVIYYRISYRSAGKLITERIDGTLNEAKATLDAKKQKTKEIRSAKAAAKISKHITLDELAAIHFSTRYNKSNTTDQSRYEKHIAPVLGSNIVNNISETAVLQLQHKIAAATSPGSSDACIIVLKAMLNRAEHKGLITKNLFASQKEIKPLVKSGEGRRERYLSKAEIQDLINTLADDPMMQLLIQTLHMTGQRPKSIISLRVKDLSQTHIILSAIKKGKARSHPIPAKLSAALHDHITANNLKPDHFIFYNDTDNKKHEAISYNDVIKRTWATFDKLFNTGLDRSDRINRATLVTLRHSYISNLINEAKMSVFAVQRLAGHASISTTEMYYKHDEERVIGDLNGYFD